MVMKYLFNLIMITLGLGVAGNAAQIGDEVHSNVGFSQAVVIPENVPVAVTHIILEDGVWDITGMVDFYEPPHAMATVLTGMNIGVNAVALPIDATLFRTCQVTNGAPVVDGIGYPGRAVDINGTQTVYLVAYKHEAVGPACYGWGFISARKIRNNH
jgi:hypothetical protein